MLASRAGSGNLVITRATSETMEPCRDIDVECAEIKARFLSQHKPPRMQEGVNASPVFFYLIIYIFFFAAEMKRDK